MILDKDTNFVYFSSLLSSYYPNFHKELKNILESENINHGWLDGTLDVWCRDYMPLQVTDDSFLHFHYYPDYLLRLVKHRGYITNSIKVEQKLGLKCNCLNLIVDGGNVVKTPNSIIITDKIFSENKLPEFEIINILKKQCKVKEVIILPWISSVEEYGHTDGIVRYIDNRTVLMTNYHQFEDTKDLADRYMSLLSEYFNVITLDYNVSNVDDNSWAYINFLQVGNFILVPVFGIPEDEQALQQLQCVFPRSNIKAIRANDVVRDGGALNCISWNIKI